MPLLRNPPNGVSGVEMATEYEPPSTTPVAKVKGPLSVSVEAENGTDSDRLSTTAFLLGPGRFPGFPGALRTHFIG